ncbi:MAG TPA: tRNA (N6-threonylcarbamoyladenosine(37)-N6)-methyltransferase TrmO [Tissierellales bacterium]|nr:tRNA (N6-threonylcarbamoyladenosine(37)-N6)-methyltransferase TrmO [Tissierellales bacterium]
MNIIMEPIGYIRSPFKEKKEIPKQSILAEDKKGIIEILPEYEEGIEDIMVGSYGIILFYFHESKKTPLKVVSHKTNKMTGVFSTRSPNRPNGIGMSIVKFTRVEKNKLGFQGVDMLDNTPILDIKPYSSKLNPE